ncbi:MAG TPA: ribosome biogenesis GTP-binding protein YihA/YsxC [Steroidobacteraceae bacterium]|nr:ribosome biogenesis GTP-binding protein YihA/YsxC [Steroidobacteraceae bacterium]
MSQYPHAALILSAADARQFPQDGGAEVAFAGRSNAGKSSAINAITGRRALARVSKSPGRTRLLNFFELLPGRRIVDLPGYGYATASAAERASWPPMIAALARRSSLKGLFLIVDSRRGLLEGDTGLIAWAQDAGRPVHVLLTKCDKLKRAELARTLMAVRQGLANSATLQAFSAVAGTGLEEARRQLDHWLK